MKKTKKTKNKDAKYPEKINAMVPLQIKEAIEKYAAEEGLTPSIVIRNTLKKALMEKGLLK